VRDLTRSRPVGPEVGRPRPWAIGAVLAVCAVGILLNYLWLYADSTPPHWDYANHLNSAIHYREALSGLLPGSSWKGLLPTIKRLVHIDVMVYPPFFPMAASLLAPSVTLRSLVMTNSWFLAVLAFSMYGMGRRLHGDLAGVMAAVLIVGYPYCAHLARQFMIDYSLLAMSAAAAYFLVSSNEFRVPWATWLFSLTAALGMLTKPTFLTFLVVPSVYTLIRAGRRVLTRDPIARRGLLHLAGSLAIAVGLVCLWYVPNWAGVSSEATRIAASNPIGFRVFEASALVYYWNILMIDQIGLPFTALFVFGLVVLRRRLPAERSIFLLSWFVGLYLLATLSPYKGTGQDIGILIPVALISAIALAGLTRFRRAACAATVAFAAIQLTALSLPREALASKIGSFRWAGSYQDFPRRWDWKIEDALSALSPDVKTVAVLTDDFRVNGINVEFYRRQLRLPLRVFGRYDLAPSELLKSDVLIEKTGWSPGGTTRGASLKGVDTLSLGELYTTGKPDLRARPDEPLNNRLAQLDREFAAASETAGAKPFVRRLNLPDATELVVSSSRPFRAR